MDCGGMVKIHALLIRGLELKPPGKIKILLDNSNLVEFQCEHQTPSGETKCVNSIDMINNWQEPNINLKFLSHN